MDMLDILHDKISRLQAENDDLRARQAEVAKVASNLFNEVLARYEALLAKQEGKMLVPEGCCMACKRWRYTNSGRGECEELNAWTDEGFYCKGFSETKEGEG